MDSKQVMLMLKKSVIDSILRDIGQSLHDALDQGIQSDSPYSMIRLAAEAFENHAAEQARADAESKKTKLSLVKTESQSV